MWGVGGGGGGGYAARLFIIILPVQQITSGLGHRVNPLFWGLATNTLNETQYNKLSCNPSLSCILSLFLLGVSAWRLMQLHSITMGFSPIFYC